MLSFLALIVFFAADNQVASVRIEAAKGGRQVSVVATLPDVLSEKLAAGKWTQEMGERHLRCCLIREGKAGPALLGSYDHRGRELWFMPRFPLEPGNLYRVYSGKTTLDYRVPLPAEATPAVVEKVYPTSDVLPANHLRFYIYFSRPMRGGQDIFDHLQILDDKGQPVNAPWLRDEIWDEKSQRLILYVHPGRIKWDIMLRLLLGPVLLPDREYTLVIRGDILDADGRKLGKEYRKKFRTTAEDRVRLDTGAWKVKAPSARTREPAVVAFDKAVDHASLQRFLTVMDSKGKTVSGSLEIGKHERSWSFRPAAEWRDEEYSVKIDPRLEDPSGNTPEKPFDVDRRTPQPRMPPVLSLRFHPKK
jgi:hypothetical protein